MKVVDTSTSLVFPECFHQVPRFPGWERVFTPSVFGDRQVSMAPTHILWVTSLLICEVVISVFLPSSDSPFSEVE